MVICPEHAKIIAGDGFSKADVKKFLWQRTGHRMSEVPEETFNQRVKRRPDLKLTRDSVIPVTDTPEDIIVVVAGGDGSQSQYIHVWGQSTPEGGDAVGHQGHPVLDQWMKAYGFVPLTNDQLRSLKRFEVCLSSQPVNQFQLCFTLALWERERQGFSITGKGGETNV